MVMLVRMGFFHARVLLLVNYLIVILHMCNLIHCTFAIVYGINRPILDIHLEALNH